MPQNEDSQSPPDNSDCIPSFCQRWGCGTERWTTTRGGYTYHRVGGPAIVSANGDTFWYHNGKLHREGGPAIEADGVTEWYIGGKLHRLDGPAWEDHISFQGRKRWFIDGVEFSEGDFPAAVQNIMHETGKLRAYRVAARAYAEGRIAHQDLANVGVGLTREQRDEIALNVLGEMAS